MEGKVLTDPELDESEQYKATSSISRAGKLKFLEEDNKRLTERCADLEQSLKINKQIMASLIDAVSNSEYQSSYQLFQDEISNLLGRLTHKE